MTRRGSIAYYMAAVVVGCFFATAALSIADALLHLRIGIGFFPLYAQSLVVGSFTMLLSALLLRRLAVLLSLIRLWQWMLLGAAATFAVAWGLRFFAEAAFDAARWSMFLTAGPVLLFERAGWILLPAGAATAVVLRRIHLAFAEQA